MGSMPMPAPVQHAARPTPAASRPQASPRMARLSAAQARVHVAPPATFLVAPGAPASPARPRTTTAALKPRTRRGPLTWMRFHKTATLLLALLVLGATAGIAAIVFSQALVATPMAGTSPVVFASGDDITSLVSLGLAATPTITSGGGSASITLYGIPGASALSLGEILELTNTDTADNTAFTVSLSVSGSPAASLTGFTITFLDDVSGTPTLRTWDLLTTPTLTTYTLSDGETWEFNVSSLTMTAAASGSQGALTITATITQV